MKRLIFLWLAIFPYIVWAQKAKIEFEKTSHNFGTISERGGKAIYDFKFKNTGSTPLILTNVRSGCGCTTPEWSRRPVAPGATGSIKVSFDPRNRPGSFVKSITVNSNASNNVVSLTVRGNVIHKPAGPYDDYKYSWGAIKLMQQSLNLGSVKNTQAIEKTIEIINSGSQLATVTALSPSPHITVKVEPAQLAKDQKGKIIISYNAAKKNDWGFVNDEIALEINEKVEGKIQVTANISEDFTAYNGNFKEAPVIALSEKSADLTDILPNYRQSHEFYIQNEGQSDLIIRKIKCSDKNTTANVAKQIVKPGKKVKVTLDFMTPKPGLITKIIQFTTNDPKNPITTYKLNGKTK